MAEARRLALVHSPLTGPSTWRPVERLLPTLGIPAAAIDYGGVLSPDSYGDIAERIVEQLGDDDPVIVVAHSGAGGLGPSVVERLGGRARGLMLVDAILPHPGQSWVDTAPPGLVARLRDRTEGGCAPRWDTWFGARPLCALVSDPDARAAFIADLPRVPMAFLEAAAPIHGAWREGPVGYVQLSQGYAAEAAMAETLGWPVSRAPLGHLAMIEQPEATARLIAEAASGL